MTWILYNILPFILLLGILVFVHESGHFLGLGHVECKNAANR